MSSYHTNLDWYDDTCSDAVESVLNQDTFLGNVILPDIIPWLI